MGGAPDPAQDNDALERGTACPTLNLNLFPRAELSNRLVEADGDLRKHSHLQGAQSWLGAYLSRRMLMFRKTMIALLADLSIPGILAKIAVSREKRGRVGGVGGCW